MDIDFLEYKVRNGDTLSSIASRLGITGEDLKLFHNSHCQKMDRIWFENLNEVKNVFVPILIKTKKQKDEERKNALPTFPLSDSFFAKKYKVTETFKSPFEPTLTVDYSVNIDVHKDKNKGHYILSYHQDQFTSNGNPPDAKMSYLSISCMKSIMPIYFILNEQGKITGLADHKKIVQTFAEQRKDLEDFFIGEISEKYLDTFEKNIADEQFFLQQFLSTMLFQTLFPKMDWFHKKTDWPEALYFLQNSFSIPCNMSIEQKDEDQTSITTMLRGNNTEFYSLQEIKSGTQYHQNAEDPVSGEFIIEYTTHKKNKNLIQASGSINLWREAESIQQHTITITQG
ncbi:MULTISPECIES: LysM peptidoglycan-binding domain-containing protein [Chryseobacterium]|uniref:LysM peptidoglycan-binding domain-containing protein n=1 Tax=Chryseobacterium TaxID=59732 RepID=UPI001624B01E|nr:MULTISPECIES: LysM peptidoglycan-binding domain-containing protein [Chryseobacterium]MDM1553166.1 LysM peptidoglycan-binding domain-containing protein [Chryseobacterium indologenes]